jgi:glycosyltransferase involved in cell wall biosynthesis
MSDCKVSICMTTYNRSELIEESINNILSQSYSYFELFVIDDFSCHEHRKSIKVLADKIIDTRVNFIFNEENKGLAFNRNLAISLSTGQYFTFKDDDDKWSTDFLLEMIAAMNVGSTLPLLAVAGYVNKNTGNYYKYLEHNSTIYDCFIDGYTPPVGSQFYSLALVKAAGGYSDVRTGVDHDLWINIVSKTPEAIVTFLPNALVSPDAFLSSNNEKMTTNFPKRTKGINESLIFWESKLKSRFSKSFYNHFLSEYNFYLCHRFITFAAKKRDFKLFLDVLNSQELAPHVFTSIVYLFKQLVIGRLRNNYELRPLFRKYRGGK